MLQRWPSAAEWAERMFGTVKLGDQRRSRRLVEAAARIAERPHGSLPSKFDWNELRGVYRLMNRPEATADSILTPHYRQVREEMARHPVVLVVHDTTYLDFTSHRALRGSGHVGNAGRGFLQHNSLAVLPNGELLGLASQQLAVRRSVPAGETPGQRRRRERESRLWAQGAWACGSAPAECCWVDVADRGADVFDFLEASRQAGHHFLVRAAQNRKILVGRAGEQHSAYLFAQVRGLAAQAFERLPIASRAGRPAREAVVALAAQELWICPPWPEPRRVGGRAPMRVWVERIWEPEPPPGCPALEWILISSLPIDNVEQLRERQRWYARRWPVAEEFHQVEKTGCGEEQLRFETAEAMGPMLALLSVVAVRIMQLRDAERQRPDELATEVASELERRVIAAQTGGLGAEAMTIRAFVRGVARLGGYLGRKNDGPPGWKTLWRGYQRLRDIIAGMELAALPPPTDKTACPTVSCH